MLAVVLFVGAVNLRQFVDDAAAVVWAAAVSADVFVLVAAVAVALAAAVTPCLVMDPGPGSVVELVRVAE